MTILPVKSMFLDFFNILADININAYTGFKSDLTKGSKCFMLYCRTIKDLFLYFAEDSSI